MCVPKVVVRGPRQHRWTERTRPKGTAAPVERRRVTTRKKRRRGCERSDGRKLGSVWCVGRGAAERLLEGIWLKAQGTTDLVREVVGCAAVLVAGTRRRREGLGWLGIRAGLCLLGRRMCIWRRRQMQLAIGCVE